MVVGNYILPKPKEVFKEMDFKTVVKKDTFFLRYVESIQIKNNDPKLLLDFDCWGTNIDSKNYLDITDKLHVLNEKTIKEPVYELMRKEVK